MQLHLWQIGFTEASFIRGGTSAYNVFKCMEKDCHDGGSTQKYPIEICPFLGGGLPGEGIEVFSIMTSIGGQWSPPLTSSASTPSGQGTSQAWWTPVTLSRSWQSA